MTGNNKRDARTTRLARQLKQMTWVAFALVLVVSGIYFHHFNGELSSKQETWGQFGDFIGGVLNPIIGFLALIALLLTIVLQSKELSATREEMRNSREELAHSAQALQDSKEIAARQAQHYETQAKKEDIYRMISQVFSELREMYQGSDRRINAFLKTGPNSAEPRQSDLSQLFGTIKNKGLYEGLANGDHPFAKTNIDAFTPFIGILHELKRYLELFEQHSGDQVLSSYYKLRYEQVVWDMHQKGFVEAALYDYYSSK